MVFEMPQADQIQLLNPLPAEASFPAAEDWIDLETLRNEIAEALKSNQRLRGGGSWLGPRGRLTRPRIVDFKDRFASRPADEALLLSDIRFYNFCRDEMLGFRGHAHLACLPGDESLVSRSKLAHLLKTRMGGPAMQGQLTGQIADTIVDYLGATGVALVVRGEYSRGEQIGAERSGSVLQTVALRGRFLDEPELRSGILYFFTGGSC